MKLFRLFVATTILGLCAPAQILPAGTSLRTVANAYSRGSAGMGAGELMQRFDADEVRGFGIESAYPGVQVVRGVVIQARNFGFTVGDGNIDVYAYVEDLANPGFPDLQSPLAGIDDVAVNNSPFGVTNVAFLPPALLPVGRDLFIGVRFNGTTTVFGGVRLNTLFGTPGGANYELAGAGMPTSPPQENSHRLFRDLTTNALSYESRGQYSIELRTRSPGGFPTALTNQANYPISTVAPGTTTMMSGLHPDAADPSANPGRVDEVGFIYGDPFLLPGSPVAFLAAFADFGPNLPLDGVVPGSIGGLCLDQAPLFPLGVELLGTSQRAFLMTTIPPAIRLTIGGQFWTQQAVALDPGLGTLRATQCGKQLF